MPTKIIYVFAYLLCATSHLNAQARNLPKDFSAFNITASFGAQKPAGDLAQRFGTSLGVGGGIEYVKIPSGWSYSLSAQYFLDKMSMKTYSPKSVQQTAISSAKQILMPMLPCVCVGFTQVHPLQKL